MSPSAATEPKTIHPAVFQKRAGGKQERINTLDTDTDMKLNNTFQS